MRLIWKIIKIGFFFFLLTFAILAYFVYKVYISLPDPAQIINDAGFQQSSNIYDRTGKILLYQVSDKVKRTVIAEDKIPSYLKLAVIAAEDNNFYSHKGLSFRGVIRAAITDLKGLSISQGGSTITQQFVRNYFLTREKTIQRKVKEILLTYKIENQYDKDKILYFYLNQIPFGSNIYGVQEAANFYFSKNVEDINLAEAAILAAIIRAPSVYSPYGQNPLILKKRQEYVLQRMQELGFINKDDGNEAKYQTIKFSKPNIKILAPHFVMQVIDLIDKQFGKDFLEKNGLKVITTLDYHLQEKAEQILKKWYDNLSKDWNFDNMALVSIDPKTGQVLDLVGSKDYFDIESQGNFNVATLGLRQPGSAIKPLVYATLFEKGYTSDTILFDAETNFSNDPVNPYIPKNYDLKNRGPVLIKEALAGSLNVPAVKALYLADLNIVAKFAKKAGLDSLDIQKTGLSLVLGGGAVKLVDLTNLYAILGNDGIKNDLNYILKIEDSSGNTIYDITQNETRVFSAQTSRILSSILSDNSLRTPVFGENSYLKVKDFNVAVKTGTSQDFKDAWTIGFTPTIATGVWIGNNDYKKAMKKGADGSKIAAPVMNDFMSYALKIVGSENFLYPDKINTSKFFLNGQFYNEKIVNIDSVSGKLATQFTPQESIKKVSYKEIHNELYWLKRSDPQGDFPQDPTSDPQFNNWETPVIKWARENFKEPFNNPAPTETDNIHTKDSQPQININLLNIDASGFLTLNLNVNSKNKISKINLYINNDLIETFYNSLASYNSKIPEKYLTKNDSSNLNIKVEAIDVYYNKKTEERSINI